MSPHPTLHSGEPGDEAQQPMSIYKAIADRLRRDIRDGILPDGSALPSTRELARQWATSTFTVTRALDEIRAEGLIRTKPRSMHIVTAPPTTRTCTCGCTCCGQPTTKRQP